MATRVGMGAKKSSTTDNREVEALKKQNEILNAKVLELEGLLTAADEKITSLEAEKIELETALETATTANTDSNENVQEDPKKEKKTKDK